MEGYYVKPKSYGKAVYRRPSVPVKKDEEKTDVKETEGAETDPVRSRAENLGIGRHGVDAWANESEKGRNYSGSMATYKVYWDAGYKGTKYEDIENPVSDYVSENMKKRAYEAGVADAGEKGPAKAAENSGSKVTAAALNAPQPQTQKSYYSSNDSPDNGITLDLKSSVPAQTGVTKPEKSAVTPPKENKTETQSAMP